MNAESNAAMFGHFYGKRKFLQNINSRFAIGVNSIKTIENKIEDGNFTRSIRMVVRIILFFILSGFVFSSQSQIAVPGDHFNPINRNDTSVLYFYESFEQQKNNGFQWIDPFTKVSHNSHYARTYNDGPVWKGKGLTWETHAGFQGRIGKLSYTFYPVVFFSQNASYSLVEQRGNLNPLNYQHIIEGGVDWVQRYGDDTFFYFHPGQSEVRLDLGRFIGAVSTQNYSWGPSRFNPIMMSRQAGGFPHLRLGLKPFDFNIGKINIGKLEYNMIYGLLRESDHFDTNTENDRRYFNSFSLSYQPSFLKDFKVGINKVLYKQTRYFAAEDIISPFYIIDDGVVDEVALSVNDTFDQLASFTFEWNFREVGFRAFAEYAVNDFSGIIYIEPEHSRGLTIGFEKVIDLKDGRNVNILYEHTNLTRSSSFLYRPEPPYYIHGVNRQGYTHNGQILGAGIGPGANSDNLLVELIGEKKSMGLLFQRIESNKDWFIENIRDKERHDQEYTTSFFYQKELDRFVLVASAAVSYNFNRYYEGNQENIALSVGARWKLADD